MTTAIDISYVLPVFNKADVLPFVIGALARQRLDAASEYVFVDDGSTDGSLDVLHRLAPQALERVRVLAGDGNAGPSLRVNQGAAAAAGRHLCLLDADELIAPDAVSCMRRLLADHAAELVHGKVAFVASAAEQTLPDAVGAAPAYSVEDRPLRRVLCRKGLVRMAWLVDADAFRRAGGCDARIFIQDESLALRLCAVASRLIDMHAAVTYAPRVNTHLSRSRAQQHHDRFFAYYNFLGDHPELPASLRRRAAGRCISAAFKAVRHGELEARRWPVALRYAAARLGVAPSPATLERLRAAFAGMPGIRRPVG